MNTRLTKVKVPRADGSSKNSSYHKFIKREKRRLERHRAKEILKKKEETPQSMYNRYFGYET